MPIMTTITRLQCERIKRHLDEHACDWCGAPVYVGDKSYYDETTGGAYCSVGCEREDAADRSSHGGIGGTCQAG